MFNLSLKRKILLCIGLALLSVILLLSDFPLTTSASRS